MTLDELKQRTKRFAISVIDLMEMIPRSKAGNTIAHQIARPSTSIEANYRAACAGQNQKKISFTRSRSLRKRLTKHVIGQNCLRKPR